jgi:hypothetical protein
MANTLKHSIVAALLGITLGCGGTAPATPTPVVVIPAPVAPVPAVRTGDYTLTASADAVPRGGPLSVAWSASSTGNDWIELSKTGDSNMLHGWSAFTDGVASGTFTLTAPSEAGQYEFRYLLDDGWIDVARSGVITVY